ncbi:histidine phosphatase family protein [Anaerocolumna sp. AGMB13025]|uniref:histidine phosphatase family protein n=1 Tax=Anaerocolumna sp. AGMB13025 TaxID=3039116 RepID=UPI00241F3348|nr:histidine phosphatase family protein [Anaerocolumna sp. AGMB13025]WFR59698.1 histidine phosphatase family protein [Anaerocolumna sp. AGMB13025]
MLQIKLAYVYKWQLIQNEEIPGAILEDIGANMRIGLLRHFKVNCPHKRMMTSKEFREWSERYETSRVIKKQVEMYGIEWDICYVSDLPRAITTAKEVYSGNLNIDKLLREVDNAPFIHSERLRLPFEVWHVCGRLAWFFKSKSQPETVVGTRKRINAFLNRIDWSKENILIVFHGFMLFNFQRELRRRGFSGEKVKVVKNGVLYQYVQEEDVYEEKTNTSSNSKEPG